MTTEKILSIVARYRTEFEGRSIPKQRMSPQKSLADLTSYERLCHAHWLLDGIENFAKDPSKKGKTGRHLGFLQCLLSYEGWYTLQELMDQNRPND